MGIGRTGAKTEDDRFSLVCCKKKVSLFVYHSALCLTLIHMGTAQSDNLEHNLSDSVLLENGLKRD